MLTTLKLKSRFGLTALLLSFFITGSLLSPQVSMAKSNTEKAGDALAVLIPAVALSSTLFYEEGNEGTIQFVESMVTSQIITFGLKKAIDKRRPNGECCDSFPSGHSSVAFTGASFIERRYGLEYGIPAYLLAGFVGYARVHTDKHYTEDVVAGAIIGIVSSYIFTKPYRGFEITALADNGAYGLTIHKTW